MKKLLVIFIAVFVSISSFSQDIIILKTGDEIKSKVIEITPDLVKYKKWSNQDGPIYTSNKSEVFMIKYENGTKDVFDTSPATNNGSIQISNGGKFIGTWYHKRYDGNNNKTTISISKPGNDYLVEYRKLERGGGYDSFYNTDGSFKEMGRLDGNSIVINSFIKLSLMNDNTILMNSVEFIKSQSSNQTNTTETKAIITPSPKPSYIGDYKDGKRDGKGKQLYQDGTWYDGEWNSDKKHGKGVYQGNDGLYTGFWKDDVKDSTFVVNFFISHEDSQYISSITFVGIYKNNKAYNGVLTSTAVSGSVRETIVKDGIWGKSKKLSK